MSSKTFPSGLGTGISVLKGYNPSWLSGNTNGLFNADKKALKEIPAGAPGATGEWSDVQVTLHDDACDLLDALFPVEVLNPASITEAVFSAGELLLGDTDRTAALAKLKETLGIDFSVPGRHYALVKMERKDNVTLYHPVARDGVIQYPDPVKPDEALGVQKDFHDAQVKLAACHEEGKKYNPEKLTAKDADGYIRFFGDYGTHFISGIAAGDCIFQVFSYDAAAYKAAGKGLAQITQKKQRFYLFNYYTTPKKSDNNGFAAEMGKLVSFSNDPALTKSIEAGEWHDNIWAHGNSIFTPYNSDATFTIVEMDERFTAPAALCTYITSLHIFGRQDRRDTWRRLFAGAMTAKYPSKTQPGLEQCLDADLDRLFENAQGLASAIATPTINLYQPCVRLDELTFSAADTIKTFTITTNLLSATHKANKSYTASDALIVAQVINGETADKVLQLSFPNYKKTEPVLYCNRFYGILQLATNDGTTTILDGIQLQVKSTDAEGRGILTVGEDIRKAPPETLLKRLQSSIQFSYAFLQSSLYMNGIAGMKGVEDFIRNGMSWIGKLIPKDTADKELQHLRIIALDIAITDHPQQEGAFVPILRGDEYKEEMQANLKLGEQIQTLYTNIQNTINQRRTEELIATTAEAINQNIVTSGKALGSFIESVRQMQSGMKGYYETTLNSLVQQYKESQEQTNMLQVLTDQQQKEVDEAIEKYKEKVKEWQQEKMISAAIDIISGIFTAATTGDTDKAKEAAKTIPKMAQMIEKVKTVLRVLVALQQGYSIGKEAQRDIHNATLAMEEAEKAGKLQITNDEWDIMETDLRTVLASGPDEGEAGIAKEELLGAYKKLVIRGKAMFQARSATMRLAREAANTQKLQQIATQQADYLSNVTQEFKTIDTGNINKEKLDLAGLTGYLDFLQNRVFSTVAGIFTLQEQALGYEHQLETTPIKEFSLLGIYEALASQDGNLRQAKTRNNRSQTTTIKNQDIVLKSVPVADLINGNVHQHIIRLDDTVLSSYVDVRVLSVKLICDTPVTTPKGEFHMRLNCVADTMMDRDMDRHHIVYHSLSREKTYPYKSGSMEPMYGEDDGYTWSANVNPVTPFTTWEISFPKTDKNKDISFADITVDLRLRFDLEVRIKDTVKSGKQNGLLRGTSIPISIDLAKEMQGRSVTNDWDVVYNMSLAKINASLAKQYEAIKNNPAYTNKIHQEIAVKRRGRTDLTVYDFEYGYPTLAFPENNPENVNLTCDITGTITLGEEVNGKKEYDKPETIKPQKLTATIPVSMIDGLVQGKDKSSKIYSVVIRMGDGTFKPEKMDLAPDEQMDFNNALKAYFSTKEIRYIINTLDLSKIATISDLCPSSFRFKTLNTKAGKSILQLFIQTGGRPALNPTQTFLSDLPEPIPADAESSLIISNRILFNGILPGSIRNGWAIGGVTPSKPKEPWSSKFTGGSITGSFDTSPLTHTYSESLGMGGPDTMWIRVESKVYLHENETNNISWPVENMTIKSEGGLLKLFLDKKLNIDFYIKDKRTYDDYPHDPPRYSMRKSSTNVNLNINGTLPVDITGTGKDQALKIRNRQTITIGGKMEGGGFCNTDTLESILNRTIRDQVKDQVEKKLELQFESISVFALENLLFPTGDVMQFKYVFTPADLVIFGDFT